VDRIVLYIVTVAALLGVVWMKCNPDTKVVAKKEFVEVKRPKVVANVPTKKVSISNITTYDKAALSNSLGLPKAAEDPNKHVTAVGEIECPDGDTITVTAVTDSTTGETRLYEREEPPPLISMPDKRWFFRVGGGPSTGGGWFKEGEISYSPLRLWGRRVSFTLKAYQAGDVSVEGAFMIHYGGAF
jgi:hypothetical protein